ncbi:MAG: type VI secretion system baseplate subunit TssG [Desulfococcaceae bacterium]
MASRGWGTDRPVADLLFAEGWRFDFYQAVRILENLGDGAASVGEESDAAAEPVRFRSAVGFDFPASAVAEVAADPPDGEVPRMIVTFLGLAGAHGPLPPPYAELIIERLKRRDTTLRDFLDIFNHRLVSLLYRARKLRRIGLDPRPPDQTPFADHLRAIIGMGTGGLAGRMPFPDRSLLFYGGLLAQQPRSLAGLTNLLLHFFGVPVQGHSLRGKWLRLSEDQSSRLGAFGANRELGRNTVLGLRVWDQEAGIELRFGPMGFGKFLEFLPGQRGHKTLYEWVRFFTHGEFQAELQLILFPDEVPGIRLVSAGSARLGWTTWLLSGLELPRDPGAVRLRLAS